MPGSDTRAPTKRRRTRAACTFADGGSPTNSRIRSLEEENRRLRSQLNANVPFPVDVITIKEEEEEGEEGADEVSIVADPRVQDTAETGHLSEEQGAQNVTEQPVEPNYYGTTSTLFDAEAEKSGPATARSSRQRRASPTEIQNGLIAAAAKQKQLETFNFNAGKLDFDGVDPDLGMHLLQLHWARQHHSFLLTYRPAFMRDMACRGPYFSKLLLNAIYFGAAKFSPRLEVRRNPNDVRTAGWQYRKRVKELLGDCLDKSEITTIQALLVMTNSLFALGDERSAAWLYAGIATRMIVDLGLHVDCEGSPRAQRLIDEDIEIRRRVFWGAFVVDKIQSLYQGRPATLQDFDARVPLTFLDTYEEFEYWLPFAYTDSAPNYPGSPAYSVSTFTELCRLSVTMNNILNKLYSEKGRKQQPGELVKDQRKLYADLISWRKSLPPHLDFDPLGTGNSPPPHVLSLLAMYEVVLVILHRPFVSEGHLYSKDDPTVAIDSFSVCANAATSIVNLLRVYDRDFSIKRAPYLIAYATYVAATIHVRIAAQLTPPSNAHSMLQTCLHVFGVNRETNWAVKRAEIVISNLMKAMSVTLPTVSGATTQVAHGFQEETQAMPRQPQNPGVSSSQQDLGIDIDMVIQSFQPDRSQGIFSDQVLPNPGNMGHASIPTTTGAPPVGQDQYLMHMDYPSWAGYTMNDPLFGFYGSPGDSQWMFEAQPSQDTFHI